MNSDGQRQSRNVSPREGSRLNENNYSPILDSRDNLAVLNDSGENSRTASRAEEEKAGKTDFPKRRKKQNPYITFLLLFFLGILLVLPAVLIGFLTTPEKRSDSLFKTMYLTAIFSLGFLYYSLIYFIFLLVPTFYVIFSGIFSKRTADTFRVVAHLENIAVLFSLMVFFLSVSEHIKRRTLITIFEFVGLVDLKAVLEIDPYASDTIDVYFRDIGIVFLMLAFTKLLLSKIRENYYQKTYEEKIKNSNKAGCVLRTLLYGSDRPADGMIFREKKRLGLVLEEDDGLEAASEKEARSIARRIFRKTVPVDREYLLALDIEYLFQMESAEIAKRFGGNKTGKVKEMIFKRYVVLYYRERETLKKGIGSSESIYMKFEFCVMLTIFLLAVTSVADSFGKRFLGFIYTMTTSVGVGLFIFSGTITKIFEAFVFIFFQHPFDCGDHVTINGKDFQINEVGILHTETTAINDHASSQFPNTTLMGAVCINHTRSLDFMDQRSLTLKQTDLRRVEAFRNIMAEHLQTNDCDFTGCIYVDNYEFGQASLTLTFSVEYNDNLKDYELSCERRKKLNELIKISLERAGLEMK